MQELAAAMAALTTAEKATENAQKAAATARAAVETVQSKMKGEAKEMKAAVLKPLREKRREQTAAATAASVAAEEARRRVEAAKEADNALRGQLGEWRALHTRGFVVEAASHAVTADPGAMLDSMAMEPIFNKRDPTVGESSHRLQGRKSKGRKKSESSEIERFEQQSTAFLCERRWHRTASGSGGKAFKRVTDGYALHSVVQCEEAMQFVKPGAKPCYGCTNARCRERGGGCEKQRYHGDSAHARFFLDAGVPWGDVPLVILLATQGDTPFYVRPFDTGVEERLVLNAGDLVIFRGACAAPNAPLAHTPNLTCRFSALCLRRSGPRGRRILSAEQPTCPRVHRLAVVPTQQGGHLP